MHLVLITLLALSLGLPTSLSAEQIPGTSTPVEALASDLDRGFSVSSETTSQESSAVEKTVWRFKSKEPYERSDEGNTYLRFSLTVYRFQDSADAEEQFAAWVQQNSDLFGLSKSWARIHQHDETIYRLDISCMFSKDNVDRIASNLTGALPVEVDQSLPSIDCSCGTGCADGKWSSLGGFLPEP